MYLNKQVHIKIKFILVYNCFLKLQNILLQFNDKYVTSPGI